MTEFTLFNIESDGRRTTITPYFDVADGASRGDIYQAVSEATGTPVENLAMLTEGDTSYSLVDAQTRELLYVLTKNPETDSWAKQVLV